MDIVCLDFESFFSKTYSLKKLTVEEYINGDEFEVIGVSIKVNGSRAHWYSGSHNYIAGILEGFDWDDVALLAHNCSFDSSILSFKFGITPARYIDTLSMARAVHGTEVGGSLANLSAFYGIGVKGTEVMNAMGKHLKDFRPAELAAYGAYCINDVELTYALFHKLLPHFSIQELELIDMTIKMGVQPVLVPDLPKLREYLIGVKKTKQDLLDKIVVDKKEIMSNLKFAQLLRDCGVEPPMKISLTTGKPTYAFAKTDDGLKDLLEHDNLMVQTLVEVRLGVKSSIEETRCERFIGIAERMNLMIVPLSYYGCISGRWSAAPGQQINHQNLPRKSPLRAAIKAPEGMSLVAADLSNIELRIGLWLAGEHKKLKLLGDGLDLYKDFASKVFHIPYDEVDKNSRFIAKTSCLSLLYQVGAKKLRNAIKAGINVDIGEDEAKRIVDLYREEYTGVVNAWHDCGIAIKDMISGQTSYLGYDNALLVEGRRGLRYPSGLYLKYPELADVIDKKTKIREYRYKVRNGWDKLYEGKFWNATVQGCARCVMAEAMVRIAKRYRIINCIHDCIYLCVPDAEAEKARQFLELEMCREPLWMPGIPLAVESHIGKNLGEV